MLTKVVTFITILCIAQKTQQACLTEADLKKLGFSAALTASLPAGKKIATPTVCKTLFKDHGACVDEAVVRTLLEADQKLLLSRVEIKGSLLSVLDSILNTSAVKDSATNKTKVQTVIDGLTATTQKECFQNLDNTQQGVTCLLASALASDYVTISTAGAVVKVDTATTGVALQKCLKWYDALCLTGTGSAASETLVLDDANFKKNSIYTT